MNLARKRIYYIREEFEDQNTGQTDNENTEDDCQGGECQESFRRFRKSFSRVKEGYDSDDDYPSNFDDDYEDEEENDYEEDDYESDKEDRRSFLRDDQIYQDNGYDGDFDIPDGYDEYSKMRQDYDYGLYEARKRRIRESIKRNRVIRRK